MLVTDGSKAYTGMPEYRLKQTVAKNTATYIHLHWMNRVISLLKTLGLGTYHGFRRRYIRRYLDEFVWRFNRRKSRPATFHKLLGLAVRASAWPLPKIMGNLLDARDKVIALQNPPPGEMPPRTMLRQLQDRRRRTGLLPADDHDE